jgi:SGNH domain (fused to AT3 domains)
VRQVDSSSVPKNCRVGARNRRGFAGTSRARALWRCWWLSYFPLTCPGSVVGMSAWTCSSFSGFPITGLLWREANTTGTVGLRRFYGARARRLLPVSATVGVITMIGSVVLLPLLQVKSVIWGGITSALYVGNYWFVMRRSTALNQPGIAAESAATKAGGHYVDLTGLFCTTDCCPVIIGNTLVYLDKGHLTIEYSRLLEPVIGALADGVLAHS